MSKITGKNLIEWGFEPGPAYRLLLQEANRLKQEGMTYEELRGKLKKFEEENTLVLMEKRDEPLEWQELITIDPDNEAEVKNLEAVRQAMGVAMSVPVIHYGSIMPDACPAGTAPVGSVIASEMIHPGLHSADICCSVAMTTFKAEDIPDATVLMDIACSRTHFGVGVNENVPSFWDPLIRDSYPSDNFFLRGLEDRAVNDIGTQGDGNHFLYVGKRRSSGELAIVTHHGSRSLGAYVYKRALQAARIETGKIAKNMGTLSWLDPSTDLGEQYWAALNYVRDWTKMNHICVHDMVSHGWNERFDLASTHWTWNEHNFVFKKEDGLYYHAKGATPNYAGFSKDDDGQTLVPLNMGEPILILEHTDNERSLGFAPHGAGRNTSRTSYLRTTEEHQWPEGIEVRFFTGTPDLSELPAAYKSGEFIMSHIESEGIGKIVDYVDPIGSIMAGEIDWKSIRKKRKK